MRGKRETQPPMFFAINVEDRVRPDHPLRPLKKMVDEELARMGGLFDAAYSDTGRPGVPPERLLKALLLMAIYSVRSERQLAERIDTDLLFRRFLDMDPAEAVFDATAFTHDRPRLEKHGIVGAFFQGVVRRAMDAGLTSDDHFSVDGTLIERATPRSRASSRSRRRGSRTGRTGKTGKATTAALRASNAEVDFHGKKRSNDTHASTTDPEARLYKKGDGQATKLYHAGHAVAENRNGLVMAVDVTEAAGDAEPATPNRRRRCRCWTRWANNSASGPRRWPPTRATTAGPSSWNWRGGGCARTCRRRTAPSAGPSPTSARARRRSRPAGACADASGPRDTASANAAARRSRKSSGWLKTVAGLCGTKLVGRWKIRQQLQLAAAAYNLLRIRKLAA